ncbi:MAG: hypothetical protein Q8P08_01415, partial [bacterium]|nr:hypothetical protein [bacterium]
MKKKILFLAMAVLLIVALMVPATMALAAKPGGQPEMLNDTVVLAADYHLDAQDTYDLFYSLGTIENTWEWEINSDLTWYNVQGISATGLLAAYEKTRDEAYLTGAAAAGDTLVERYNATRGQRPYSQDVEFLVRLSQDSGVSSYAGVAQQWYAVVINNYP